MEILMDLLLYKLPGIDVPVTTIICLILAVAAFALLKSRWLRDFSALALIGIGSVAAMISGCDKLLLAALVFIAVICSLLLADRSSDRPETGENDERNGGR